MNDINRIANEYDKNYFENGIPTGKSGYVNYRWVPELTIPLVYRIIQIAGMKEFERILDFGSAKGYLVYAFRLLDFEAYGCDISEYAISKSHEEIKEYNVLMTSNEIPFKKSFDWVIVKDVLEHIPYEQIDELIKHFLKKTNKCFVVVPLGDGNKYIIPDYEADITHLIKEDANWWKEKFENNGFEVSSWSYNMDKVKSSWKHYKNGNAYFVLKNRYLLED